MQYEYDEQGQLVSADDGTTDLDCSYDANGNRDMDGYETGPGNQMLSDGLHNYTYDDEGNTVKKERISDGLSWTYGWNTRNELVWVEKREEDEGDLLLRVEFKYDVFGNRVEKRVDEDGDSDWDTVERYVLEGWNPAKPTPIGNENWDVTLDLDGENEVQAAYLRGMWSMN